LPLLSIVVPCYNHSRYLHERLDTILHQSFKDFECIMLDDASDDISVEILKEYECKDFRFRLYKNEINSGSTFEQWNLGVSLSSGKYIWIAESDDFSHFCFLETLVSKLEGNALVCLAFSQSRIVDETSCEIGNWSYNHLLFEHSFTKAGVEFIENHLIFSNFIPNASAVVFRRHLFEEVGRALPALKSNGDWNLWIKILLKGDVYFESTPLNYYRKHDLSVTAIINKDIASKNTIYNRMIALRMELNNYLANFKEDKYKALYSENKNQLSYNWGNYGLFLKSQGYFWISLYFIFKSSIYPKFKTYYFKKFIFGRHYNYLFKE